MKNFLKTPLNLESITSLFSQAPVGLALLMGENFIVANANTQMLNFWQRSNDVIGVPLLDALPEIENQEFPKILKNVFDTGITYNGTKVKTLVEKNGVIETFYFDFIYAAIFAEKKITGISVVCIDVTEQVVNEIKIQEKEILFRELMEISEYSTAMYRGKDLFIEFANDQMIQSWGKTRDVIGMKLEDALPELEGQPFIDILKNIFDTGEPYIAKEDKVDLIVDGHLQSFYYSISYRPLRDRNGEIYAIWNMAMNVTELVRARMKAQNAVQEYRDLAEAMPQMVWTTDDSNKITYYNKNLTNFLNLDKDNLENFDFSTVIHPEDYEKLTKTWEIAANDKRFFEIEFRLYNGTEEKFIWFLNRATPILDEDGNVLQWIGTSTNIDEFKKLSAQKDTFLGIASHELKTPLTSLKLYAQVLERMLRRTGDDKNAEFAKKMDVQIVKLTSLIADLLDVTKINAGKIYLHEEIFDFQKLVVETIDEQQMSTPFKIDLSTKSVGMVFADRNRIGQVITNLISNAIKYSPYSHNIVVTVGETAGNVELSVKDYGIGMPADKKNRVFEQYFRVSGDEQSTFPGLGLGLYISSQIVEKSHGKISVESTLGEGSTFCFSLPKVII